MKLSIRLANDSKKGKILFHIGNQAPMPRPKATSYNPDDSEWIRPNRLPTYSGVFLTDKPFEVFYKHGIEAKKIYSVFVPFHVIKDSGGLIPYEGAKEILIPEHLWKFCKVLSSKDFPYDYSDIPLHSPPIKQDSTISQQDATHILNWNNKKQKLLKLKNLFLINPSPELKSLILAAINERSLYLSSQLDQDKISKKIFYFIQHELNHILEDIPSF